MTPGLLQGKRKKKEGINDNDDYSNEQSEVAAGDQDDLEGEDALDLALDMTSKNVPAKKMCTRYPSQESSSFQTETGNLI